MKKRTGATASKTKGYYICAHYLENAASGGWVGGLVPWWFWAEFLQIKPTQDTPIALRAQDHASTDGNLCPQL